MHHAKMPLTRISRKKFTLFHHTSKLTKVIQNCTRLTASVGYTTQHTNTVTLNNAVTCDKMCRIKQLVIQYHDNAICVHRCLCEDRIHRLCHRTIKSGHICQVILSRQAETTQLNTIE